MRLLTPLFLFHLIVITPLVSTSYASQLKPTPVKEKGATGKCALLFKNASLCGQLEWTIPPKKVDLPTEEDTAEFVITLFPIKDGRALSPNDYELEARLFMPSMGHGSLPTQVTKEAEPLRFRVKRIFFSMPGDWEIQLNLKTKKLGVDKVVIPYTL